ncbi:hypothetical protein CK203_060830 [Vitis vinifera]|uniref:Uncharacterized protein n=1 Tax=Vitis vinifera TaxID=29760 RepID=A0A438GAJ4_VITVI|nr:hypothetical protein CK203_060830 [Vitis vinifera]
MLGLSMHLWFQEVLKKIEDCCGSFIAVDENTLWWEVLLRFSKVVLSSYSSGPLASKIRGDENGGTCVGEGVGKDL